MGERHVVVQAAGGVWHRKHCLWAHVGAVRRHERVVSDEELARLDVTCDHCLGVETPGEA